MSTFKRFEDIKAWQLAREISKLAYEISHRASELKDFSLADQLRRSSGSMMDNIAEGFGRSGRFEFVRFLSIAKGSAGEVQSQLYRSLDNNYVTKERFDITYDKCDTYCRMISVLISYMNKTEVKGTQFLGRPTNSKL
jgi:four helix bundle protein